MPETTQNSGLEALRFRAGKEATIKNERDEDLMEEIADFIMIATEQFENPELQSVFRDIANTVIEKKSTLGRMAGSEREQGEQEAQQQALAQSQGVPAEGALPPTLDTEGAFPIPEQGLQGRQAIGLDAVPPTGLGQA